MVFISSSFLQIHVFFVYRDRVLNTYILLMGSLNVGLADLILVSSGLGQCNMGGLVICPYSHCLLFVY